MSNYEKYIMEILLKEKISFEREKTFKDLKQGKYRFDFYLPQRAIILEIDGEFHWKPIRGRAVLLKQQEHDRQKNSYCLANNIPLYRIPYWEIKNIHTFNDILNEKFLVKSKWHLDNLRR